jgi:hypothetical protein
MIRITIEFVPDDNETGPSKGIGHAEITTLHTVGKVIDYHVTVHYEGKTSTTFVRGHKDARNAWSILHIALEQLKFHSVMDTL